MGDAESRVLLTEFIGGQSLDLQDWWARLQRLDPQLTSAIGQDPVFGDAEYRRRGRDPNRPSYDVCDVQDSRDQEPGVWVREARRQDRLAEYIVGRYYGLHQPLQPGLATLLRRAVDAGDRRLTRFVRTVAAASQNLKLAEQLVGMDLGMAYALAGYRPDWAASPVQGTKAFSIADAERFDRQEPYLFLLRLVDGLVDCDPRWQRVANLRSQDKAA